MADVHLADRYAVDGMFIRKMLLRDRNEVADECVRYRRLCRPRCYADSTAAAIGGKRDSLPDAVSQGLAAGNAALQGVLAAGQALGQLVRLTAESAAALKALGPMVDSSGAILGVVRDGSGQFAKVLRFTSVDGLSAVASLGPALTSLALQMQLQAISKQLQEVKRIAESVAQHQKDELVASVETNIDILTEAYRKLMKTGTISAIDSRRLACRRLGMSSTSAAISARSAHVIFGRAGVWRCRTVSW